MLSHNICPRKGRAALHLAWVIAVSLLVGCRPEAGRTLSELERLQQSLPPQPGLNVIVVSYDALRADALGVYGSPRATSPHLDAFAGESVVFDRAYTVAPVTPTSFAAAFTGLLPHRVFHAWNLSYDDTLARRFSAGGYRTAAFVNNIQLTAERNFDAGFDLYELYRSRPDEEVLEGAVAWLREHREARIFAWIHFLSPHSPYDYREAASHLYDESYEGRFERTTGGKFETDDPREIARLKSLYEGEAFYGDALFGRLRSALEETGLIDSSVVVVTSDHGEEFYEHGGFQHDRLTEEHVRVPLLVYHPAVRSPLRSQVLTSNVDLFPTLLSLAGLEADLILDGRDLTRIRTPPEWIAGVSMTGGKNRWLSFRRGPLKLIQTCMPERAQVLYDLTADPAELRDLHPERPEVTRDLHRELEVVMGGPPCAEMLAAVRGTSPTVGLSPENVEALKALGYLGD